jgi:hypothetical protein
MAYRLRWELNGCFATDGICDGAATVIAAIKPCASGAPLRGCGLDRGATVERVALVPMTPQSV